MTQAIDSMTIPEKAYLELQEALILVREDMRHPSSVLHITNALTALAAMSRLSLAIVDRRLEEKAMEKLRSSLSESPSSCDND